MSDDRLGMHEPISRRDFLNGTLLASAGLVLGRHAPVFGPIAPADAWDGYGGVGDYARAHGDGYEVMSAAHRMRDGAFERAMAGAIDTGERYDLVCVGGGISGLAAAVFFQTKRGLRSPSPGGRGGQGVRTPTSRARPRTARRSMAPCRPPSAGTPRTGRDDARCP